MNRGKPELDSSLNTERWGWEKFPVNKLLFAVFFDLQCAGLFWSCPSLRQCWILPDKELKWASCMQSNSRGPSWEQTTFQVVSSHWVVIFRLFAVVRRKSLLFYCAFLSAVLPLKGPKGPSGWVNELPDHDHLQFTITHTVAYVQVLT